MRAEQQQVLKKMASIVGLFASIGGMGLTIILLHFNPYSNDVNSSGTVGVIYATLFAPALFALILLIFKKHRLMFISFLWSLPMSFYLGGTPGIFKFFGVICVLYLVSALLSIIKNSSFW